MGPEDLAQVLRALPNEKIHDANLLVGLDTSDDAGVYRLNDEFALVQTVDFFTPVVDDPYAFGQIAAANALSDIYAMGAKPLTAMNLVSFPVKTLGADVLAKILAGGLDKIREAGALLIGGHSIEDNEPKYGLSVTGIVHPEQVLSNAGAKVGDVIVLTKPLGSGLATTGIKFGVVSKAQEAEVIEVMAALNKGASEAARETGASALTDVTGFGLVGHLNEMLKASGLAAEIESSAVPVLESAWTGIEHQAVPGGTWANLKFLNDVLDFASDVSEGLRLVLADPQTSGGLLIAIPEAKHLDLLDRLKQNGALAAAVIGRVIPGEAGKIYIK